MARNPPQGFWGWLRNIFGRSAGSYPGDTDGAVTRVPAQAEEQWVDRVEKEPAARGVERPAVEVAERSAEQVIVADLKKSGYLTRKVRIQYTNRDGVSRERTIHVYGVGQQYIDAFDEHRSSERTFKIDRIGWTELTETKFERSADYKASRFVRGKF